MTASALGLIPRYDKSTGIAPKVRTLCAVVPERMNFDAIAPENLIRLPIIVMILIIKRKKNKEFWSRREIAIFISANDKISNYAIAVVIIMMIISVTQIIIARNKKWG